ncbi:MAG: hypothetical protein Alis3KO_40980 [Aliiglaciecola sp.]
MANHRENDLRKQALTAVPNRLKKLKETMQTSMAAAVTRTLQEATEVFQKELAEQEIQIEMILRNLRLRANRPAPAPRVQEELDRQVQLLLSHATLDLEPSKDDDTAGGSKKGKEKGKTNAQARHVGKMTHMGSAGGKTGKLMRGIQVEPTKVEHLGLTRVREPSCCLS